MNFRFSPNLTILGLKRVGRLTLCFCSTKMGLKRVGSFRLLRFIKTSEIRSFSKLPTNYLKDFPVQLASSSTVFSSRNLLNILKKDSTILNNLGLFEYICDTIFIFFPFSPTKKLNFLFLGYVI